MRHPLGVVMNTFGSMTEALAFLSSDQEDKWMQAGEEAILALVEVLGEAPFLESIGNMFEMYKKFDEGGWDGVKGHIARTGATYLMPWYVGARQQIRRAIDPIKHDTSVDFEVQKVRDLFQIANVIWEGVKDQTPGFSETLLADRSVLSGKPIEYPQGAGPGSFIDNDPLAGLINLMNPLFFLGGANSVKVSPKFTKQEIKVAQWMANNDMHLPNPPRQVQGVTIPNNLYQQWKALIGSSDVIDPNSGEVLTKNVLGITMLDRLELIVDTGDATPVYDENKGKTWSLQRTQFAEAYSSQQEVALLFLMSTPDWQPIQQKILNRMTNPPAIESPSNPVSRVPKGISLTF